MNHSMTTPWRGMWLLLKLRLRRLLNVTGVAGNFGSSAGTASRKAGAGKKKKTGLIMVVLLLPMLYSFSLMAQQSLMNMACRLDSASACHAQGAQHAGAAVMSLVTGQLASAPFGAALFAGLTLQLTLLLLVAILVPLGAGDLSQADWDLEWLVTLPLSRTALLCGRLLERSVVNPAGWFALLPMCCLIAWYSGQRWMAVPLGLLGAFALLLLAALPRTLIDTGLRLSLPPSRLRNLQALLSVASLLPMYGSMSFGMAGGNATTLAWAGAWPAWSAWTPPGLVLALLNRPSLASAALLLGQLILLTWAGLLLLRRQLRDGVVVAGQRESTRKITAPDGAASRWAVGSVVQRRELTLLARDRNFLVQSMLMPVVMLASQLLINGQFSKLGAGTIGPVMLASTAFGIGAYVLMLSAFQAVNKEGGALWLLYTFPGTIARALWEKAQLWAALALIYPLAIFGAGLYFSSGTLWQLAGLLLIVLAGMPLYALIAIALGVFACNPQATQANQKVRLTYLYLYMLLTGLYIAAIAAGNVAQQLVFIILTAALALALWQKARDAMPYLMDPDAAPPQQVSLADGLMAAMLFFVLQALLLLLMLYRPDAPDAGKIVAAFALAGMLTYGLARLSYWRSKTIGVPRLFQRAAPVAWGISVAAAAGAIVAGIAYLAVLRHFDWLPHQTLPASWWMFALAVVAAPLCEEFIFRGLIFGGLRRSMGAPGAIVISAAIFAIVHPPLSMLPVFVLGLCTGFAYERGKMLLAPMLVHAAYNAAVVGYQML